MIPAFRGEFGLKVRYHVPQVYAMGPGHVIEIEEGEEALYPLASEWRIVPRVEDSTRRKSPKRKGREGRFIPEPHVSQGVSARVVICPRLRSYGSAKNWPHWDMFAGIDGVFAAGAPDSSYEVSCPRAWDYSRFLDASIEAIRSARLVVATDAGLAHLAVLCGTPLLMVTHRGLVAPGPVLDERGRAMMPEYWPVRWEEYYVAANHMGVHMERVYDGWTNPEKVVARALELAG